MIPTTRQPTKDERTGTEAKRLVCLLPFDPDEIYPSRLLDRALGRDQLAVGLAQHRSGAPIDPR